MTLFKKSKDDLSKRYVALTLLSSRATPLFFNSSCGLLSSSFIFSIWCWYSIICFCIMEVHILYPYVHIFLCILHILMYKYMYTNEISKLIALSLYKGYDKKWIITGNITSQNVSTREYLLMKTHGLKRSTIEFLVVDTQ